MNDKQRLEYLERKLENQGLTIGELQEIALIHSRALNAAKQNIEQLLEELRAAREQRHQYLKY